MIADAHNHLDELSPTELETVLAEARAAGVELMVTVAMDGAAAADGIAIAQREEDVFAAAGLHPWLAQDYPEGPPIGELRGLASQPEVVAIGEIGLDFVDNKFRGISYRDPKLQRTQEAALRKQLRLAKELELPVILHSRGAHETMTRILGEEGMDGVGGCVQFFEGTPEDVNRYVELGFTFSIGSSVSFPDPGGWYDTVRSVPADRLLLESDAPWLPYSGKESERSAPSDLRLIGATVAELRGVDSAELFATTAENLRRALPGIPESNP